MNKQILSLYFVAGSQDCRHLSGDPARNLIQILDQALDAGITCFQFRDKGKYSLIQSPQQHKQLAKECQRLCAEYNVPFIVNDDVDLAIELGADGIHVGQTDMSIQEIKTKVNSPILIGVSVNTLSQALAQDRLIEVDYFGVGPIFPTQSKEDAKPPVGVNFVETLRQAGIKKPFVAIGGVDIHCSQQLREKGATGIAVISAITKAQNIQQKVKELLR